MTDRADSGGGVAHFGCNIPTWNSTHVAVPASLVPSHVGPNGGCHGDGGPAGENAKTDINFLLASVVAGDSRSASWTLAAPATWEQVRDSRRMQAGWVVCRNGDCLGLGWAGEAVERA